MTRMDTTGRKLSTALLVLAYIAGTVNLSAIELAHELYHAVSDRDERVSVARASGEQRVAHDHPHHGHGGHDHGGRSRSHTHSPLVDQLLASQQDQGEDREPGNTELPSTFRSLDPVVAAGAGMTASEPELQGLCHLPREIVSSLDVPPDTPPPRLAARTV